MAQSYEQRQAAITALAHAVRGDGWTLHGYSPDRSRMEVDHWEPARWQGLATKAAWKLVVDCPEGYPRHFAELPAHRPNPPHCNWHLECGGAIVAQGRGLARYSQPNDRAASHDACDDFVRRLRTYTDPVPSAPPKLARLWPPRTAPSTPPQPTAPPPEPESAPPPPRWRIGDGWKRLEGDLSSEFCIVAAVQHLCAARDLDFQAIYRAAYPTEDLPSAEDLRRGAEHADVSGWGTWPAGQVDALLHDLTDINYHALRTELARALAAPESLPPTAAPPPTAPPPAPPPPPQTPPAPVAPPLPQPATPEPTPPPPPQPAATRLHNPDGPATSRQLWYLHCLLKTDTRDWKLTKAEASTLIDSLTPAQRRSAQ